MNQQDEQFSERNFCYYKRGAKPFYEKCGGCNGYNTVCSGYTCDSNYKIHSTPTLAEKMEEYFAKWKAEGFYDAKPAESKPNQLELGLEYK